MSGSSPACSARRAAALLSRREISSAEEQKQVLVRRVLLLGERESLGQRGQQTSESEALEGRDQIGADGARARQPGPGRWLVAVSGIGLVSGLTRQEGSCLSSLRFTRSTSPDRVVNPLPRDPASVPETRLELVNPCGWRI